MFSGCPKTCVSAPRVATILALFLLVSACGCITPVVMEDDVFAVGAFSFEKNVPHKYVTETAIQGVGITVINGRVAIGFHEGEIITADIDDKSYHAITRRLEIMVGEKAEEAAPGMAQIANQ